MSIRRRVMLAAVAVALAAAVGACGKKPKTLDPPDGDESGYPREYPTRK